MTLTDVRSRYDADATAYLRWWAPVLRREMQPLLDEIDWSGALRVLETGCGTGILLADIAARVPGATVVGVDASYGMLSAVPGSRVVVQGDAQRLPLTQAAVDVVLSGFMLQHVDRPDIVFAEWARVLTPGGRLAVAAWVGTEEWLPVEVFTDELARAGAPDSPTTRAGGPATDSPDKLRGLAEAAGLTVVSTDVHPLGWDPTLEEVIGQLSQMRATGRRLAMLSAEAAAEVRARATERLRGVDLREQHPVCRLHAVRNR